MRSSGFPTGLRSVLPAMAVAILAVPLAAQQPATPAPPVPPVARVAFQQDAVTMELNDTLQVAATAYDSSGKALTVPVRVFSTARRSLGADQDNRLIAYKPGEFMVLAVVPAVGFNIRDTLMVTVNWPKVQSVTLADAPARLYAGTVTRQRARVVDVTGAEREDAVTWRSSNPSVLTVDRYGYVTAHQAGSAVIHMEVGGVEGTHPVRVVANPVRSVALEATAEAARVGDVVHFTATARDAAGRAVGDAPVTYSLVSAVEDTVIASEAAGTIDQDGSFVAQRAGVYTVLATSGGQSARKILTVNHRAKPYRVSQADGHGSVSNAHTSDLWVWSGKDGKDYAVTGTWGANGVAYFWDVTDPTSPVKVDSVQVDARTVNDVKVDEERGICVISREGASNRKNGFVVLDCSNPRDVKQISTFDDGLYGGVHNVFIWNRHVFAINQGTRFDIISIEDPANPRRVGVFELDTPGHGIHDIWVVDGIAYTSNWGDGVWLIDVGNGMAGGTPEKPVAIGSYKYPIGATHSAFPYRSRETGKFYVFVGDEQFPYGLDDTVPDEAGGYIHIVDFTDMKKPVEVARYDVPEAGPHNFWIQNDTLYVAYYNAGLRVVDIGGELKGNLYNQEREIARFQAFDANGYVANAPMAWGPQPHKGYIFFSDFNSGLWSVKLPEPKKELTP